MKQMEAEFSSDQQALMLANEGNEIAQNYLIRKYKNMVKVKARPFFIVGADSEDIFQEGMIGLYKAIKDFKPEKGVPFPAFAELCVNRQLISALKSSKRKKYLPLNSYVSFDSPAPNDESGRSLLDVLTEKVSESPEDVILKREEKGVIEAHIDNVLSKYERKVLSLYLEGKTYYQIAAEVNKEPKSIDNALQRLRKKLKSIVVQ